MLWLLKLTKTGKATETDAWFICGNMSFVEKILMGFFQSLNWGNVFEWVKVVIVMFCGVKNLIETLERNASSFKVYIFFKSYINSKDHWLKQILTFTLNVYLLVNLKIFL